MEEIEKTFSSIEVAKAKEKFSSMYRKALIHNAKCGINRIAQYTSPGEPHVQEYMNLLKRHIEACVILAPYVAGRYSLDRDYLELGAVHATYEYLIKHNDSYIDQRDPRVEFVSIICDFHQTS